MNTSPKQGAVVESAKLDDPCDRGSLVLARSMCVLSCGTLTVLLLCIKETNLQALNVNLPP